MPPADPRVSGIPAERADALVPQQLADTSPRDAENDASTAMTGDAVPYIVEGPVHRDVAAAALRIVIATMRRCTQDKEHGFRAPVPSISYRRTDTCLIHGRRCT